MAYRDPYGAEQYGRNQSYPAIVEHTPDHNPYTTTHQPHQTYDQGGPGYDNYGGAGGYRDDPLPNLPGSRDRDYGGSSLPHRQPSQRTYIGGLASVGGNVDTLPTVKERDTGFDHANVYKPRGEKTARAMRQYRYDHQGNLWTKGSRGRCIGRFCCCTLMVVIFLIISIVLALALWIRPPSITIDQVGPASTTGSTIQLQEDGVTIKLGVNITVNNPNYFAVNFKQIKAEIFYPINNTLVGGGTSNNIVFGSHSQKNFTFPFSIEYKTSLDPRSLILIDLAQKCGVVGSAKSNIVVDYQITLGIRILFITISPVVSNSMDFTCPLSASDIQQLIKSAGIDLGSLLGNT